MGEKINLFDREDFKKALENFCKFLGDSKISTKYSSESKDNYKLFAALEKRISYGNGIESFCIQDLVVFSQDEKKIIKVQEFKSINKYADIRIHQFIAYVEMRTKILEWKDKYCHSEIIEENNEKFRYLNLESFID